jgi:hypothetical protein
MHDQVTEMQYHIMENQDAVMWTTEEIDYSFRYLKFDSQLVYIAGWMKQFAEWNSLKYPESRFFPEKETQN